MAVGVATRRKGRAYVAITADPPLESGQIRFMPSADHALVESYEVRVRDADTWALVASTNIGKPAVSAAGTITVDLTTFFGTIPAGNYTLTIAAINDDGESESDPIAAFALPLS